MKPLSLLVLFVSILGIYYAIKKLDTFALGVNSNATMIIPSVANSVLSVKEAVNALPQFKRIEVELDNTIPIADRLNLGFAAIDVLPSRCPITAQSAYDLMVAGIDAGFDLAIYIVKNGGAVAQDLMKRIPYASATPAPWVVKFGTKAVSQNLSIAKDMFSGGSDVFRSNVVSNLDPNVAAKFFSDNFIPKSGDPAQWVKNITANSAAQGAKWARIALAGAVNSGSRWAQTVVAYNMYYAADQWAMESVKTWATMGIGWAQNDLLARVREGNGNAIATIKDMSRQGVAWAREAIRAFSAQGVAWAKAAVGELEKVWDTIRFW